MNKKRLVVIFLLSLAFLVVTFQPAFSWKDNQYRTFDSYETRTYGVEEFKQLSGQEQPQLEPSFWQGVLSGANKFFDNVKEGFGIIADFTKNLFANMKNIFLRPDDTQQEVELEEPDSKVDKPLELVVDSQGLEVESGMLAQDTQATESFLAGMESGQSIFEPTKPEQVSGQDVEQLRQQIRQGQAALRGQESMQPETKGVAADIFRPTEGLPSDTTVTQGKIIDTGAQQIAIEDFQEQITQVQPIIPLQPQKPTIAVMPGESWEGVKTQITPKEPTLLQKGKDMISTGKELLLPEVGAEEFLVKDDLVKFIGFFTLKFQEVKASNNEILPGEWQKTAMEPIVKEFGGGLALSIGAGTDIKVRYIKDNIYEVQSSKPLKLSWGFDGLSTKFTTAQIEFSYSTMQMRVIKGDFNKIFGLMLVKKGGWDVRY